MQSLTQSSAQIDHLTNSKSGAFMKLMSIGANPNICFANDNSSNDYFIPYSSYSEYSAFLTSVNQGRVPGLRVADCYDYPVPAGIYTDIGYFTDSKCSSSNDTNPYPVCPLGNPIIKTTISGGWCQTAKYQRTTMCGTLFHPFQITNNQVCWTGMTYTPDRSKPKFCYGHYDTLIHTCVYEGQVSPSSGVTVVDGQTNYAGYSHLSPAVYPDGYDTRVNSWGVCYTKVPTNDGICSTDLGENCHNSNDCGACPVVCGDYSCDSGGGENCLSCPTDCGACYSYCHGLDQYSCQSGGSCSWDYSMNSCADSACVNYYDQSSCQSGGCTWDYNYYSCY
jgi:hypothetical protein